MPILSRRTQSGPATAAAPADGPRQRRVGFKVATDGYSPDEIEAKAMKRAREFFGPGWDLEITDDYVLHTARSRFLPDAEIIVWATPRAEDSAQALAA